MTQPTTDPKSAPTAAPTRPSAFPGGPQLFRLDPGIAHLNHGSFGAVPIAVQEVQAALLEEVHADPDTFFVDVADRIASTPAAGSPPTWGPNPTGSPSSPTPPKGPTSR